MEVLFMKKLLSAVLTISLLATLVSGVFAEGTPTAAPTNDGITAFDKIDKSDPMFQGLITKRDQILELRKEHELIIKDIETQTKLNKELRVQIKDKVKAKDQAVIDRLKSEKETLKSIAKKYKDVNTSTQAMRLKKKAEWKLLQKSIDNKNLAQADKHAQNIIDFKKKIIENSKKKLELKKEIYASLSKVLGTSK
jgi:hypothetical protein